MNDTMYPEPVDRFFISDGVKLHYTEWGDPRKDTALLIHGIRDQGRSWSFLLQSLTALGKPLPHAVALDLRGHGDSDWTKNRDGYQHEDFLYDISALQRHLNKKQLTLIGHSLGGSMAIMYAGCFPDRVKKLVSLESVGPFARADEDIPLIMAQKLKGPRLVDPSFYPTLEDSARAIKFRFPLMPDEVCAHMAQYGSRMVKDGYVWKYDPVFRFRSTTMLSEGQVTAFIKRLNCPILIIYGTESEFLKSTRAPRIELFQEAKIVAIEGAGHHVPHEKPDEVAKVMAPFLFPESHASS